MKLSQAQRRILLAFADSGGKLPLSTTPRQLSVLRKAGLLGFEQPALRWFLTAAGRAALEQRPERKAPAQRKPLKKLGKRGMEWKQIREKELDPAFKAAGIKSCEAKLPGCWKDKALTLAHTKKRRYCTTPELIRRCAMLCVPCHDSLEACSHEEMERRIEEIIAKRVRPVVLPTVLK